MPELNSSLHSQRVIAGRDLENSILKGRRSRLKQYAKLLWSERVSIINVSVQSLYCTAGLTVVSFMLACAVLTVISYWLHHAPTKGVKPQYLIITYISVQVLVITITLSLSMLWNLLHCEQRLAPLMTCITLILYNTMTHNINIVWYVWCYCFSTIISFLANRIIIISISNIINHGPLRMICHF